MKKVRFETPDKPFKFFKMNERECHSPRPLIERQVHANIPDFYSYPKVLPYSSDPVHLFECSNSSPYPVMNKTQLTCNKNVPVWSPTNDLDLSMLDASNHEPRRPTFSRSILKPTAIHDDKTVDTYTVTNIPRNNNQIFSSIENQIKPPNVLVKDNDFFIRRDNLEKFNLDINPMNNQFCKLSLDKENNPLAKKAEIMQIAAINGNKELNPVQPTNDTSMNCSCHHCIKNVATPNMRTVAKEQMAQQYRMNCGPNDYFGHSSIRHNHCPCILPPPPRCSCCDHLPSPRQSQFNNNSCETAQNVSPKLNAVDKKTWAIEKYEQSKKSESMEVEKQTNVSKEKREPTVSDLFKIIKLQNEQLQLLQEKVDKFISASQQKQTGPIPDQVAIETVGNDQHKISIGVMTSFEMVRTSTIINKEVLKTNQNDQIQCNRSQISIKEVVSTTQSPNLNFLDGIAPVGKNMQDFETNGSLLANMAPEGLNEEKTLNEMSLYNVQVNNATTPLMSPEQSLYLDVRDYSDSEASSDDQSNVGWTYYNKVMTHVNGMLQDSDMPSSASALYRNTRQHMQTVQMQIDKTNVSVTKRVKFGDDPLGLHQPHLYPSTDTSLKMNQLAAKYLKNVPPVMAPQRPPPKPAAAAVDMSFATRNYMERHKLLQGNSSSKSPLPGELPRFLDITALKQQPKFL